MVSFQAIANKLLSAAPILKTREQNQKVLTIERIDVGCSLLRDICSIVAVTAEKNVATVEILKILLELRFCSCCIAGIPVQYRWDEVLAEL